MTDATINGQGAPKDVGPESSLVPSARRQVARDPADGVQGPQQHSFNVDPIETARLRLQSARPQSQGPGPANIPRPLPYARAVLPTIRGFSFHQESPVAPMIAHAAPSNPAPQTRTFRAVPLAMGGTPGAEFQRPQRPPISVPKIITNHKYGPTPPTQQQVKINLHDFNPSKGTDWNAVRSELNAWWKPNPMREFLLSAIPKPAVLAIPSKNREWTDWEVVGVEIARHVKQFRDWEEIMAALPPLIGVAWKVVWNVEEKAQQEVVAGENEFGRFSPDTLTPNAVDYVARIVTNSNNFDGSVEKASESVDTEDIMETRSFKRQKPNLKEVESATGTKDKPPFTKRGQTTSSSPDHGTITRSEKKIKPITGFTKALRGLIDLSSVRDSGGWEIENPDDRQPGLGND